MPIYEVVTDIGQELINDLAANMRAADIREMEALGYTDTAATVGQSVRVSSIAWAALVDGKVALIAGAADLPTDKTVGVVWMLGTDKLEKHAVRFLRNNIDYLQMLKQRYTSLVNVVHADNIVSIGWLRSLGFTIYEKQPYGPKGELFHCFKMGG